jgi:tRNA A-37 threonylcarbamoyl transferase component Bud32
VIGTLLDGRFRLEEQIGSGGMSRVYRALDEKLERWVAIKVLHSTVSADPDQLERFRREARTVARLSHPHVTHVIDAGEDDGTPYIVLEYVEGETLKDCIRRSGRLPVSEAVAYAIEIGRALGAAHAAGIVHRDVKPQNVLIDLEGRAKVTDFGIARSLELEGLTQPGRVLGTTDYVSPEQALGHRVTEASDLYSLGICLYEMLVGEVPFRADTQVGVAMQHVKEPLPDVRHRRPEISASLAAVLERATAKDPRARHASADALVHELEQVLAIEVARAGQMSGEATTVLRALPGDTADFVPLRLRNPRRLVTLLALMGVVGAVVVVVLANRTQEGTTGRAEPPREILRQGLVPVKLAAAKDYDPFGTGGEHARDAPRAIDGNRSTYWDTEDYRSGLQKPGVGLYIEAEERVAARRLSVITGIPGWIAEVYAANSVPESIDGWRRVSRRTEVAAEDRIRLDTRGRRYANYLVWITELPEEGQASILELTLQRPGPAEEE